MKVAPQGVEMQKMLVFPSILAWGWRCGRWCGIFFFHDGAFLYSCWIKNTTAAESPIVLSQHLLLFIAIFSLHRNPHAYSVCHGQSEGLEQSSTGRCRLLHPLFVGSGSEFFKKSEDKSNKATDHASRFHGAESSAANNHFVFSPPLHNVQ